MSSEIEERGVVFALVVNVTRIVIYALVMLAYLQAYYIDLLSHNSTDFLVPGCLAFVDVVLIILSFVHRRYFWKLLPLVSFIAMLISVSTLMRSWNSGTGITFLGDFMLILALFIFLISTSELIIWAVKGADITSAANNGREDGRSQYRSYVR